jgi:hypothetical protein
MKKSEDRLIEIDANISAAANHSAQFWSHCFSNSEAEQL